MQLLYFGVSIPEQFDNDHWSHAFRHWLDALVFKFPTAKETLDSRMRMFRFIDKELRDASTRLRAYCRKHYNKDYYLLRSVPGIGGIVACGILCELGDLRRFQNIKPKFRIRKKALNFLTLSDRKKQCMKFDLSFTNKEITPWGGMVFLKQMLDKIGFRAQIENCKSLPTQNSNRAYSISTVLESFITSVGVEPIVFYTQR